MKRLLSLSSLCLALAALVIAGCGSSSKKDSGSSASSDTTAAKTSTGSAAKPAAPSAPAGATVAVQIKDIAFKPHDVTAKVGQTIEWTNDDGVAHTVTAKADGIDSGMINAGSKFSTKVTKAGKIKYICQIHPGQEGTITVTQ